MQSGCDFAKFGCKTTLLSEDHGNSHVRDHVAGHLKLVVAAYEREFEKNRLLGEKVDALYKWIKEHDEKISNIQKEGMVRSASSDWIKKPAEKLEERKSAEVPTTSDSFSKDPKRLSSDESRKGSHMNALHRRSAEPEPEAVKDEPKKEEHHREHRHSKDREERHSKDREATKEKEQSKDTKEREKAAEKGIKDSPKDSPKDDRRAPVALKPKAGSKSKSDAEGDDIPAGYERGTVWEYDATSDEWARGQVVYKMEPHYFAQGALRNAHMLDIIGTVTPCDSPPDPGLAADKTFKNSLPLSLGRMGHQYVAKLSKTFVAPERYFEDVKTQVVCKELGGKFNQQGTPKRVEVVMAWILDRGESTVCGLEPYIAGEFSKSNNNFGSVLSERNTPQAFSHFTWEHSNHTTLVVDVQGVDDYYTDLQIHTKDGKGFGTGNMGMKGIQIFLKTHKCNPICMQLNLPLLNVDTAANRRKLLRGTMKAPSIEADLQSHPVMALTDIPDVLEKGEFQCVQTFSGHEDRVLSLCVTSKLLFSASADGTVKVWNLPALTPNNTFRAHRKEVWSMCANAKHLFTASGDMAIKVWDITDFTLVERLREHSGEVNDVVLGADCLYSASFDKTIKIWDTKTLKHTTTLEGHSKSVKTLLVTGQILFSGSNDGTIKVWNLKKMQCIFSMDAHEQWVKALALKDNMLYSGAYDYLIKEWDLKSFMSSATVSEHSDNVSCLLATDRFLFSASEDKTIRVWDYVTKKCLAILKGHRSGVQSVASDGKHIFSGADDYTVKVWKWVPK